MLLRGSGVQESQEILNTPLTQWGGVEGVFKILKESSSHVSLIPLECDSKHT